MIETITSGTGMIISDKDLNECLREMSLHLIKYSELELRTRGEHHAIERNHL